jgi:hypothetical protein
VTALATGLEPDPPGDPAAPTTARSPAVATPILRQMPVLGFGINAHHISDLSLYLDSVDAIASLGANTLLLVTPMYQDHVDSSEIRLNTVKCPTNVQLSTILQRARRRGLQTVLLPIVLIESPGEKDWRGVLKPKDPQAWWASYDCFIDYFLEIAVANSVDVFSVGSELNGTEHETQRWRGIIDRVRQRFKGRLTYTANWDRYEAVDFWQLVDFISVSSYFELAPENPDAPLAELTRAWRIQRNRMLAFARAEHKPLVLMELGYPSLPWAAAHPWDYVARDNAKVDQAAQARCYRAFFDAWTDSFLMPGSPAIGFNCYKWDPYSRGGADDTGYGVRGKPALAIIRRAFEHIRTTTAPAPVGDRR